MFMDCIPAPPRPTPSPGVPEDAAPASGPTGVAAELAFSFESFSSGGLHPVSSGCERGGAGRGSYRRPAVRDEGEDQSPVSNKAEGFSL